MKDSLISANSVGASAADAWAKFDALFRQENKVLEEYKEAVQTAQAIRDGSARRLNIPVRDSFVLKNPENKEPPPLSQIVSRGGRGGVVALKLYLALIWKCAAEPYETEIPARRWAELLALEDPKTKGARRISKALDLLEELQLVSLYRRPGTVSVVTLLDESGDGSRYIPAPTANAKVQKARDRYFKISTALWTSESAYIQRMSSAGLAMLLILLQSGAGQKDEKKSFGKEVWWSVTRYQERYAISPAMRSRGTKELSNLGLLNVQRQSLPTTGQKESFAPERVRNMYQLHGEALEIPHA